MAKGKLFIYPNSWKISGGKKKKNENKKDRKTAHICEVGHGQSFEPVWKLRSCFRGEENP